MAGGCVHLYRSPRLALRAGDRRPLPTRDRRVDRRARTRRSPTGEAVRGRRGRSRRSGRWVGEWSAPAWGLSGKRAFRGDLDPEDLYPDPAGGEAYRVASFQAGAIWLAGVPLLWSLVRLRHGVRNGWDAPAGRWRRAARPWGLTGAVIGAAALALGPGDSSGSGHEIFDGVDAMATVRRDPFSPGHPRFLRLALDLPTPPVTETGRIRPVPEPPAADRLGRPHPRRAVPTA